MNSNKFLLAAKTILISASITTAAIQPASAGIPVVDALNLTQTTISSVQQVAQVAKQVEEYKLQLQQYQNMLENTATPDDYIWSDVNSTITKLVIAQQTLDYYKNQTGSIDAYLRKYEDVDYYRNSPCFQIRGCSDQDRYSLDARKIESSDAVKRANADVIRSVDQQQQTLTTDARKLQQLQSQATSATGQMQALQAANQLAAAQGNQLLQIRGMLLAQNQAASTLAQQQADRHAQEDAASTKLRDNSNVTRTSSTNWSFK